MSGAPGGFCGSPAQCQLTPLVDTHRCREDTDVVWSPRELTRGWRLGQPQPWSQHTQQREAQRDPLYLYSLILGVDRRVPQGCMKRPKHVPCASPPVKDG